MDSRQLIISPLLDKDNSTINDSDSPLQLSQIKVDEDYCKKWNERMNDFVVLTKNFQLVNNSLYRVGGIGTRPDGKNYFMLLKYVEDYYPADIMRQCKSKDPKHLSGRWCILDKNGVEKFVSKNSHTYPYLLKNSCIYSINQSYYNIETGELYCHSYHSVESSEYLFLQNNFDTDESRRGVMKINKKTGLWELFP